MEGSHTHKHRYKWVGSSWRNKSSSSMIAPVFWVRWHIVCAQKDSSTNQAFVSCSLTSAVPPAQLFSDRLSCPGHWHILLESFPPNSKRCCASPLPPLKPILLEEFAKHLLITHYHMATISSDHTQTDWEGGRERQGRAIMGINAYECWDFKALINHQNEYSIMIISNLKKKRH